MAKARKKPIEVEFFHWTGQPKRSWPQWVLDDVRIRYEISSIGVDTDRGPVRMNLGDYLIKGTGGEVYPCDPDRFAEIYEIVEE